MEKKFQEATNICERFKFFYIFEHLAALFRLNPLFFNFPPDFRELYIMHE